MFVRALFSRSPRSSRRRGTRRHQGFASQFDRNRGPGYVDSLLGFGMLESRAMLAADDVVVSLAGGTVALTLDNAGVQISDLSTAYNAASKQLTITAARTAGTISTNTSIPGITIDSPSDTITVNLATIPAFAGISVVGGNGTDTIVIGAGGIGLKSVGGGAANQSFTINTGAGLNDVITVANAISAKGAGAVSLTTLGGGNAIIFNAGYGLNATGNSTGSVVTGNQISNNVLGNIAGLSVRNWFIQSSTAPGLTVQMPAIGQAASLASQLGLYSFSMAIDVNSVSIGSAGSLNASQKLTDINTTVQSQKTEFRQIGSTTYVNAKSLGATGTPWVSLASNAGPAATAVNSLVSGLTPTNTLSALQFPISSKLVGSNASGKQYQATIGSSTFAALLPLSNLTELAAAPVLGNDPIQVNVSVNAAGYPTKFTTNVLGVGTIAVSFSNYGTAVQVAAPMPPRGRRPSRQPLGLASSCASRGRSSAGRLSSVALVTRPTSIRSRMCVRSLSRNAVSFMTMRRSRSTIR